MNQSFTRYKSIGILLLVLCIGAIGCAVTCLCIPMMPLAAKLKASTTLLACASALYYMLKGYSKNAAAAYKGYMAALFVAFQQTTVTIGVPNNACAAILSFCGCLAAAMCLALCVSENMGEKLSKGMSITVAVVSAFIGVLLVYPGTLPSGAAYITVGILVSSPYVILALIAVVMTFAKYKDKTERGTK